MWTGCGTPSPSSAMHVRREEPEMARVLDQILDAFYERLDASKQIDAATIEALRILFQSGKKLKADDFVAILESATKEAPQ